jgi:hypothetical protein
MVAGIGMEIGAEENKETQGIYFYTYLTSPVSSGLLIFRYGYEILLSVSFLSVDLRLNPYSHLRVETDLNPWPCSFLPAGTRLMGIHAILNAHPHHHMPQPRWVVIPYPPPMVGAPPPQFAKHFSAGPPPPPPAANGRRTPTPPAAGSGGNGCEENKTIWVGDLQYWMDENYLHSCFGPSGEVCVLYGSRLLRTRSHEYS